MSRLQASLGPWRLIVSVSNGRTAGDFHWVHNLALDAKGNVFSTEVDTGKRAQKFLFKGDMVLRRRTP
jgi:hypothetical protein